jgi:hypothetical protein
MSGVMRTRADRLKSRRDADIVCDECKSIIATLHANDPH